MHPKLILVLTLPWVLVTPVLAASSDKVSPEVRTVEVRDLTEETNKLQGMVANFSTTDENVAYKARHDFEEKIPEAGTVNIAPFRPQGWQIPSRKQEDRQGTIESITRAGKTALLDAGKVPSPITPNEVKQLVDNTRTGESLRMNGMVSVDHNGFLRDNMLGAYIYTKIRPVGVKFHPQLSRIAQATGDIVAWVTFMHEYAHAYMDQVLGTLSPAQTIKGEEYAFHWQAKMWDVIDPTGQMISVLYHDFVEHGTDPKLAEVIKHNVELRHHDKNGTLVPFIQKLGYKDKTPLRYDDRNDLKP